MNKPILWLDMDGVLVDLEFQIKKWFELHPELKHIYKGSPDRIPGLFRNPPPIEGSLEAVHTLYDSGKYEMLIATAAPWGNPESAADKRYWIETHYGRMFHKKITVTHRKDLLYGDVLVDDRTRNGAAEFRGKFIHFGSERYPDWGTVLDELL